MLFFSDCINSQKWIWWTFLLLLVKSLVKTKHGSALPRLFFRSAPYICFCFVFLWTQHRLSSVFFAVLIFCEAFLCLSFLKRCHYLVIRWSADGLEKTMNCCTKMQETVDHFIEITSWSSSLTTFQLISHLKNYTQWQLVEILVFTKYSKLSI